MRRGFGGRSASSVSDRGAAAVEFALLVPIFLVMVFGIMDFGLLIYSKTVMNNAAREGARTATLGGTLDQSVNAAISAAGAVTGAAPTVTTTCTLANSTTSCPNWVSGSSGTAPPSKSTVKVTVNYTYVWMTPLVEFVPGLGSSEAVRGFSQMVVE